MTTALKQPHGIEMAVWGIVVIPTITQNYDNFKFVKISEFHSVNTSRERRFHRIDDNIT